MDIPSILGPAAVLALWSMIVMLWLMFTRFKAFSSADIDLKNAPPGARYVDIEKYMPAKANWVTHNFVHLMEQPTVFYAVIAILAIAGDTSTVNIALAWGYVLLRIFHSLWQSLVNTQPLRVILFVLSTVCLLALAVNGVRITML